MSKEQLPVTYYRAFDHKQDTPVFITNLGINFVVLIKHTLPNIICFSGEHISQHILITRVFILDHIIYDIFQIA